MFGYVRPLKGEMKVREYEQYRAVYCTLCREMGRHYGILTRLFLSYDITFYAVMALDISGAETRPKPGRCVVNPAKKCSFLCEGQEEYKKAAALNILMTYYKLVDNIEDEKYSKRLGAKALKLLIAGAVKKARKDFPKLDSILAEMMKSQKEIEKKENASIDESASPTAEALRQIFSELGGDNKSKSLILGEFGYYLGRWVYLIDAADDLKDDLENKSFNPYIDKLELRGKTLSELSEEQRDKIDIYLNEVLNNNAAMINSALNLLDLGRYGEIVKNVTELGLGEVQREILFLHIHEKGKNSVIRKTEEG